MAVEAETEIEKQALAKSGVAEDPHADHDHGPDEPCDGGCWLVEFLNREDGTVGIEVKHGPDGERMLVCQSYPWDTIEEASSRSHFILSEIDAAIATGTEVPQESMTFFKIHPPINYPEPQ